MPYFSPGRLDDLLCNLAVERDGVVRRQVIIWSCSGRSASAACQRAAVCPAARFDRGLE